MSFKDADLSDADFRDCNLQRVNLNTKKTSGIKVGGADLTGAELPEHLSFQGIMDNIAEASKGARATLNVLLTVLVFSVVILFSVKPYDLLIAQSDVQLPLLNIAVSVQGFVLFVPVLILALQIYFHLSLRHLLLLASKMPAIWKDGHPLYLQVFPWLLNTDIANYFRRLKGKNEATSVFHKILILVVIWWGAPLVLCGFYLRILPVHIWQYSLYAFIILSFATVPLMYFSWFNQQLFGIGVLKWKIFYGLVVAFLLLTLAMLCVHAIVGDMRWRPEDERARNVFPKGNFLQETRNSLLAYLKLDMRNYHSERRTKHEKYISGEVVKQIDRIDLSNKNLRYLVADGAFLANADFHGSDLSGAIFIGADLRGADFTGANLKDVRFHFADVYMANFTYAKNLTMETLTAAGNVELAFYDPQHDAFHNPSGLRLSSHPVRFALSGFCQQLHPKASEGEHEACMRKEEGVAQRIGGIWYWPSFPRSDSH